MYEYEFVTATDSQGGFGPRASPLSVTIVNSVDNEGYNSFLWKTVINNPAGFDVRDFGNDGSKPIVCWVQDFKPLTPILTDDIKNFINPPTLQKPTLPLTAPLFPQTKLLPDQKYTCYWDILPSSAALKTFGLLALASLF